MFTLLKQRNVVKNNRIVKCGEKNTSFPEGNKILFLSLYGRR